MRPDRPESAPPTPRTADPEHAVADPTLAEGVPDPANRIDRTAGRMLDLLRAGGPDRRALVADILLPVAAVVVALLIGAVLLAAQGVPVLVAYGEVLAGAFGTPRALANTAVTATPLILIGLGVAIAYRAKLITIGAEGQFLVGAIAAVAVVTAPPLVAVLPGPVLLVAGLVTAAAAGAAWSAITALLNIRWGASVVITSLLLNYIAQAVLAWATRTGIADPDAFTPQTRPVGDAELPTLPASSLHLGFALAIIAVIVCWIALDRGRFGLRVEVMGANAEVLRTNETSRGRYTILVLAIAGALAGFAGFVEVAGVTTRITGAFSGAVGFTAVMVALLGRLHPLGVFVAAVLMAALSVGFAAAGRSVRIPSTTVEIVQAIIVLLFVAGGALLSRRKL